MPLLLRSYGKVLHTQCRATRGPVGDATSWASRWARCRQVARIRENIGYHCDNEAEESGESQTGRGGQLRKRVNCGCTWSLAGKVLAKKTTENHRVFFFFFSWNSSGCVSTSHIMGVSWSHGRWRGLQFSCGGAGWVVALWQQGDRGGQPRLKGLVGTLTRDRQKTGLCSALLNLPLKFQSFLPCAELLVPRAIPIPPSLGFQRLLSLVTPG